MQTAAEQLMMKVEEKDIGLGREQEEVGPLLEGPGEKTLEAKTAYMMENMKCMFRRGLLAEAMETTSSFIRRKRILNVGKWK